MSDSLRSISTNDSLGQTRKKKKTSQKTRPQNISYSELIDLLNPNHLFININLEEKFNKIEIPNDTPYFPEFKFVYDENLSMQETKWRRLPTLINLSAS